MSLLPAGEDEMERDEAISTLRAYAFILDRGTPDQFDVHRLVRLTMQDWLRSQGEQSRQVTDVVWQLSEAGEMHRETLTLREEVLGREHPDTLGSMNNLALVLHSQGKYSKAE